MYTNITEYGKNVIGRSSRTFAASFVIGEKKYSDIKSLKVMVASVANGKITIGGTVSKNVEIIVDKVDILPGTKIYVYEGVKLDSGEYEDVPMGTYKIRGAVTKANMTTIVAEGPLSTETSLGYFSELNYPATTIQMLGEISEAIGVPIVTDNLEELYVESKPEGYTYREVIGFIAGMHGTNAVELRDGSIGFKWYEYCEDDIFTDKADAPELSNDTFIIEKFECETGNATIVRGAGKTGIVISNPLMTEAAAGVLWEKIAGFSYKPATFNIKSGTPLVDEWNYFSYGEESIIATELQFTHDGGLQNTFKSVGESETASASGYKGPLAKALERYQAELVLVNEALVNKLSVEEADIRYLQADKLEAITAEVESAVIKNLEGDFATFDALNATNAQVALLETKMLSTENLSAEVAKLGYATITQLDASNARITALETNQLTVSSLKSDFADIALSNVAVENVGTLFARVGLITDATIQNGHVTGYLDSVEVNANSITAGTLSVDRLIFRGTDKSIVYELNNITGALQSVQGDTLNGEILTDRSITVDKIVAKSITADEIAAGTITANEIAANTITAAKIASNAITADKIAANAITANKIAAGAITANKIDVNDLFSKNITATGTITGVTIVNNDATSLSSIKLTAGKLYTYSSSTGYKGISIGGSKLTIYAWDDDGTEVGYLLSGSNKATEEKGSYLVGAYGKDVGLGVEISSSGFTYAIKAYYDAGVGPIILSKSYWKHEGIFEAGCAYLNNTAMSLGGNLRVNGNIECTDEIVSSYPHGGRIVYGDYGTFWRNDGANLYLMFTAAGNPYGGWNALRPLFFDLQWGNAWFGHNLTVGGALSVASEIKSSNSIALRSAYGNYGAMFLNDGDKLFYFLCTNKNDTTGSFNSLRPFYINMETGSANFGHAVGIDGILYANSQVRIANNVDLYCMDTSGVARSMVAVDGSNIGYLGWGVLPMLRVGCPANTGRLQLFSKSRIDFLPGGSASANELGVSLIKDDAQRGCLRGTLDNTIYLGNNSYRFAGAFLGESPVIGSDRRLKNNIVDMDDRYMALAKLISTKTYNLNNPNSTKRHAGYIAQDVEAAMASVGLSEEECAFFSKNWVEREDYTGYELSLVYEELHTIQIASLQKQVNELKTEIIKLKATN